MRRKIMENLKKWRFEIKSRMPPASLWSASGWEDICDAGTWGE